jgi:EmrB/QacA subfamily drug resistance transporter
MKTGVDHRDSRLRRGPVMTAALAACSRATQRSRAAAPVAFAVGSAMVRPMSEGAEHKALDHAAIRTIMVGILLAMFLSALEQTIVAPALPTIGKTLADVDHLSWVVTAYLLAATAVTPLFGKLSDIYGRRVTMLAAVVIFIAGSVACALAPTMPLLIAARALQGIGGGGILPLAHTIIGDMVTPRERPRYMAYTSVMFMVASIIGPVLGGVLTDWLHWTMIFWINLPLGLVALVMTDRALRNLPRHDRPHQLDVAGATLMVGAALSLMLAMSWGGTRYPWGSWPLAALLSGSAILWAGFALRVARAGEPFIPLSILRQPVVGAVTAAGFFGVGVITALSIFLPLYFELVLGFSPSGSGLALIVFLAGATAGSFAAGWLMIHIKHYKRVPIGGLILAIAMFAAFAITPAGLTLLEVAVLLTIGGAGLGVMYPVTTVIMQNAVAPHQLGTATGTLNFCRHLGSTIIVAAFSAILLGGIDAGGQGLTLDMLSRGAARSADFAPMFGLVFAAGALLLVAALVAVWAIEERPLRGPARPAAAPAE